MMMREPPSLSVCARPEVGDVHRPKKVEPVERIVADDELELIPQGMEKCRFDPEYAPYAGQFVGYRDLQLGARFKSAETRDRGLDQHVIEIQLHLRVFEAIKKGHVTVALPVLARMALLRTGSGHRTYVSCRNLRCS